MNKFTWVTMALAFAVDGVAADRPDPTRWESVMESFAAADAAETHQPGSIVFVGSSSIRLWDLSTFFPDLPTINRGFGGSHLADAVHYADRLVVRHRPHTIVLYAGDNDIAYGLQPVQVAADYEKFVQNVRQDLPRVRILFIGIKPSVSRFGKWPEMNKANGLIRQQIEKDPLAEFVDIAEVMLDADGQPRAELFVRDGLHLNQDGYAAWTKLVRQALSRAKVPIEQ